MNKKKTYRFNEIALGSILLDDEDGIEASIFSYFLEDLCFDVSVDFLYVCFFEVLSCSFLSFFFGGAISSSCEDFLFDFDLKNKKKIYYKNLNFK